MGKAIKKQQRASAGKRVRRIAADNKKVWKIQLYRMDCLETRFAYNKIVTPGPPALSTEDFGHGVILCVFIESGYSSFPEY
jgi:hypothetical protein